MKKAIIIDWLDKYGGAERVIQKINNIFHFDQIYTLTNIMKNEEFVQLFPQNKVTINDTILRKSGSRFRIFYFSFFYLISKIKIDKNVDLIISSSHSVAKGISKSRKDQVHISYFQARNSNYIWDEVDLYFGKFKILFYPLLYVLRRFDIKQSQKPDFIVSNSIFVQQWVKKVYNRDSVVIYPPVNFDKFNLKIQKEDYYVIVGRIAAIKRFDIVIKAFNNNKRKLIVIGDGEELESLKNLAKSDQIFFKGFQTAEEVAKYVGSAKAFIQVGIEGFGIAPLEAQACGTPVIAYAKGGVLETIIENKTGVFFNEQSVESLNNAILIFEQLTFDNNFMRNHALNFSEENFERNFKQFVESKIHPKLI
ncbi:glycosyltransferase [Faecalibacter macacae]|uniref:Glycosyltransferase family 4 protein n=1 Tax=Faecalibacter macacae TaxID=1859289 RepID=A0A3L9MLJ7_9FLAO|nr:glycosyltransferase [Faecalibacter macacae]RLZ11569.1 glycosyltransferase family 4 protein [Faecalibacter macacae]